MVLAIRWLFVSGSEGAGDVEIGELLPRLESHVVGVAGLVDDVDRVVLFARGLVRAFFEVFKDALDILLQVTLEYECRVLLRG